MKEIEKLVDLFSKLTRNQKNRAIQTLEKSPDALNVDPQPYYHKLAQGDLGQCLQHMVADVLSMYDPDINELEIQESYVYMTYKKDVEYIENNAIITLKYPDGDEDPIEYEVKAQLILLQPLENGELEATYKLEEFVEPSRAVSIIKSHADVANFVLQQHANASINANN